MVEPHRLSVDDVSKTFGRYRALRNVHLDVVPGEVHGLIGQNGSGKSTLAKVLTGYHPADPGGRVLVDGEPLRLPVRPREARQRGLAVVHQSLGLVDDLTVVENLRVGRFRGEPLLPRHPVAGGAGRRRSGPGAPRPPGPARRPRPGADRGGARDGRHRPGAAGRRGRPRDHHLRRIHPVADPQEPGALLRTGRRDRRHRHVGAAHHPPPRGGPPGHRPGDGAARRRRRRTGRADRRPHRAGPRPRRHGSPARGPDGEGGQRRATAATDRGAIRDGQHPRGDRRRGDGRGPRRAARRGRRRHRSRGVRPRRTALSADRRPAGPTRAPSGSGRPRWT